MLYIHKFKVKSKIQTYTTIFPIDMLRYDECFPSNRESSYAIELTFDIDHNNVILIELTHYDSVKSWRPTKAKWEAYSWLVVEYECLPT